MSKKSRMLILLRILGGIELWLKLMKTTK
jgi:hypothetical protein